MRVSPWIASRFLGMVVIAAVWMTVGLPASAQKKNKKDGPNASPPTKDELLKQVKPAEGFSASIFAMPPDISYPTCLYAAPNGDVYVGVDLNGSLGKVKGRGKVVRCIDTNNDGAADSFTTFCEVQHPRGLHFHNGRLLVLHPPFLSAFIDEDGDGKSDRQDILIKGISTDATFQRGADHTTNSFRLGIDGWLYIAVGDFGFLKAEMKDGKTLQLYGGGVVRVRPDGTELEIVSHGQRNIYDVAVSPTLDLFTRDNTNDGGGWDVRLSHVVPLAHFGYPSLYKHFNDEIFQPLNDFGGGSPTGSMYLQEPGFPEGFGDSLYTVEWGRSAVLRHPLTPRGAGYEKSSQTPLVNLPAPTDIDVDGSGRVYVSSWRGGGFSFSNPYIGFIARIVPTGWKLNPMPDVGKLDVKGLLDLLSSPSHARRQAAQLEILRRGENPDLAEGLQQLIASKASVPVRVAALFTLKQLAGPASLGPIMAAAQNDDLREFAIRAASDRVGEGKLAPTEWLTRFLADPNPRVRLQALIALGRLQRAEAANAMLPLAEDTDPVVRHIAIRSLSRLQPADDCLAALAAGKHSAAALRVLQTIHDPKVTNALLSRLNQAKSAEERELLLPALCRLYFKEHDWDGKWWGTRPDTTGPYFKRVPWSETKAIGDGLQNAMKSNDSSTLRLLVVELKKHKIDLPGVDVALLKLAGDDPAFRPQAIDLLLAGTSFPDNALPMLAATATNKENPVLRARALRGLHRFMDQKGFFQAAVDAFTQLTPADLGNKEFASAWEDFTRDGKHANRIELFSKLSQAKNPVERDLGWAVLVNLATGKLTPPAPRIAAQRAIDQAWGSEAVVPLLRAIANTKADAYAFQVRGLVKSDNAEIKKAAQAVVKSLGLDKSDSTGPRVELKGKAYDAVHAEAMKIAGDPKLGALVFLKQGCIACHTVLPTEPLKGPYLGDIAARYKRPELLESILKPSAKLSQGFETVFFALANGKTVEGFVVRESGEEVELRNAAGVSIVLNKDNIEERSRRTVSVMPEALADNLTIQELASLVAYLESLNTKK